MSQKFENSLPEGSYNGNTRLWFELGAIGDVSTCSGTLRAILGGRFLLHEYTFVSVLTK